VLALVLWTALVSVLLYRNYVGSPFEVLDEFSKSFSRKISWYDIYIGKKKIGFAKTAFEEIGDEIIIRFEQDVRITNNGSEDLINQKIKYLCKKDYSLKSFELDMTENNDKKTKIEGKIEEDEMLFFIESGDDRRTKVLTTDGRNIFLPASLIHLIIQRQPAKGSIYIAHLLNIMNLSVDNVQVITEDIIPVKIGLNVRSVYKFRLGQIVLWGTEDGTIVKKEFSKGITYYKQSENIVKEPEDRILFDYTTLPFFSSNILIPYAEEVNSMKVKIEGIKLDPAIYENGLVKLMNDELTIVRGNTDNLENAGYMVPVENAALKKYITPDEWVKSDNEAINHTGRVYARARHNDAYKLTVYLTGYVYNLVRTNPLFILSDSETVLKTLQGDFLEKAVMLASYARAAGLPTRLVGGLVYKNGHFFFHAWNEVWFDKWIPVDPTFDQFPADVTHIPLVEGSLKDIVSILENLNNLKIEVLEVS
ncbi:MAG: transglutaminase-like domain-containing protein, partial [Thermodesulfovibrionales bacterium]